MWECKKCHYHNSNSNKTCHGKGCKVVKKQDMVKVQVSDIIKKPEPVKRIYDFCPFCKKDVVCRSTTWKGKPAWRCTNGVHKPMILKGKSKPFPPGLLESLKEQDRLESMQLELPDQIS